MDTKSPDETLTRRSAVELAAMMRSRAVSPVEVPDAHLAAIARINPELHAIVTLAAESAHAAANRGKRQKVFFLRRDVATPYGFGEIRRFVSGLGMSPSRIVGFARHFTPPSANSFPRTNIAASVSGFCL
jgi:hypothetical protein